MIKGKTAQKRLGQVDMLNTFIRSYAPNTGDKTSTRLLKSLVLGQHSYQ